VGLTAALESGRALAEQLMTDAVIITAPGEGEPVFDPETGDYSTPEPVTLYEGKCRVQVPNVMETTPEYGGREVTVQTAILSVPVGVEDVPVGATATITAAAFDPDLVGAVYRVTALHHKSQPTARRFRVEETTA